MAALDEEADDPYLWLEDRDEPEWDVLLGVDALNEAEGGNWVWGGVTVLCPGYDRCLIRLSRGGAVSLVPCCHHHPLSSSGRPARYAATHAAVYG